MKLAEAIVALAITLVVVASALRLTDAAAAASARQPEALDVQQRARVALDAVARDLAAANVRRWPGAPVVPAVLPMVLGIAGDAAGVVRGDAITVLAAPASAAAGVLAAALSAGAPQLRLAPGVECGSAALCGFTAGDDLIVVDASGAFDIVRLVSVGGGAGVVRQHGRSFANVFAPGSRVWQIETRSYYLDSAARVLRQYDGDASDQPVADQVTDLTFEYLVVDATGALSDVPLAQLGDGPWIGAGSSMYDADWRRIRGVRVRIGAEAATAGLRAVVPRVPLQLLVAPRALALGTT